MYNIHKIQIYCKNTFYKYNLNIEFTQRIEKDVLHEYNSNLNEFNTHEK